MAPYDPQPLAALLEGVRFAVQYNPLAAALTAAVAAALSGYPNAPRHRARYSALVLAVGWLLGDGLRIVGRARDLYDGVIAPSAADSATVWLTIAVWACGGLALGYVLPALVGIAVGRRVTHGTGWLAAAAVAAGLSAAISAIVGALS